MEHTMRQVDSRFRLEPKDRGQLRAANQTDKGPEGNKEVCSTTEVQYAEKNG